MKEYFELRMSDLRRVASWAAECAEKALDIYERCVADDARPRKAVDGAKEFAATGKRTNALRKLALDAYRASNETDDRAASYAANAASLAAASAFTHPFRDARQAEHILGPAVYAAFSLESAGTEPGVGDGAIDRAIAAATDEVARVLSNYPEQEPGGTRLRELYRRLDRGLRRK